MRLLVTGASGFLGKAVVKAGVDAGYQVVAMVRPMTDVDALGWPESVEIVRADLRQRGEWSDRIADVEAVVHLAAAVSGDLATQFAGTVAATETLLDQLPKSGLKRFVHVSTFSVYDYGAVVLGGVLTEKTPIEPKPDTRDAYTITKMVQERSVEEHCRGAGVDHVIMRPGAIYGPGKHWDYGRAVKLGRFDLLLAPFSRMKLTYVDNCADAIVRAIGGRMPSGSVLNVVDDDLPSHARYHRLCRRNGAPVGRAVYVPWLFVALAGLAIASINRLFLRNRARLPALLAYRRQRASWKPLRYSNAALKQALDWSPIVPLQEGVARTIKIDRAMGRSVPPTRGAETPLEERGATRGSI